MNTGELVAQVAKKTNLTHAQSREVLDAVVSSIQTRVKKGEKVQIAGFGTFQRVARKARKGRNPHTGESVKIPARKVPTFRPGKAFKEVVQPPRRAK